jgi:hypothetical protein
MRMMLVTIYALYGDDVRVLGFDKSADTTFVIHHPSHSSSFSSKLLCNVGAEMITSIRIPKDVQCGKGATN